MHLNNKETRENFLAHLKELRRRITYSAISVLCCAVLSYFMYTPIIEFLSKPLLSLLDRTSGESLFYVQTLFEGFITRLKFALIGGVILSSPIHIYHLLRFIFPALSIKERNVVIYALITSFALALFGFYICYFKLIPYSVTFLIHQDFIPPNVGVLLKFSQNIFYIFNFITFTILAFQFPIVLEILLYLNLVTRKTLLKYSRFAVVIIFIVAAAITPGPDIVSQIGVALPMVIFYFATILIAKIFKFGES